MSDTDNGGVQAHHLDKMFVCIFFGIVICMLVQSNNTHIIGEFINGAMQFAFGLFFLYIMAHDGVSVKAS